MKRPCLCLPLLLLLSQSLAAQAPSAGPGPLGPIGNEPRLSTIVDKILGEGEQAPWARLVLHIGEDGKLCATFGAKRGPGAANPRVLIVAQLVEGKPKPLELPFPSKPVRKDEVFIVWETCLEGPGHSTEDLQVTLRSMGRMDVAAADKMPVAYPPTPLSSGLNITKTSSGSFQWQSFTKDYTGLADPAK